MTKIYKIINQSTNQQITEFEDDNFNYEVDKEMTINGNDYKIVEVSNEKRNLDEDKIVVNVFVRDINEGVSYTVFFVSPK